MIKKELILLILISLSVAFIFQGKRGLYEPDEGRYSECAREMIITNNYFIPQLNLKPHLSKPPVTYWFIAGSLKLFGKNEFAARFPNSLLFFFTVILIYLIGKHLWNKDIGILSSLIYSTSIFPFIGLNFVTTDTILTFFIWLYIYLFIKKRYFLMWIAMGLAFLTKGPPCLLPFIGIIIFLLLKDRTELRNIFTLKNVLIFILVGFSWYLSVIIRNPKYFNYFINYELIGRIEGIHHRNSGIFGWMIYIPIMLFGLLPWNIFWRKINFRKDDNVLFFLFLIFIPLIIFCIVKSRLPLYLLPLFPAITLITGYELNESNIEIKIRYFIITAFILIVLRLGFAYIPLNKNSKLLYYKIKPFIKEKNYSLDLISSKSYFGLNFYFNKIIEHLTFSKNRFTEKTVDEKLKSLKEVNYFIIFDKKKLNQFIKHIKKYPFLSYKILCKNNVYLVKVNKKLD